MKKRILSLLLVLSVLTAFASPLTAWAAEEPGVDSGSGCILSPLYRGEEPEPAEDVTYAGTRAAQNGPAISPEAAAAQIRDCMVARAEEIELYIYAPDYWGQGWITDMLIPMAMSQEYAVGPTDGDYLRWSYQKIRYVYSRNGTTLYLQLLPTYYTTAKQEQDLIWMLKQVNSSLGLSSLTTFGAYSAIYDYVVHHVTYATEELEYFESLWYPSVENGDYDIYTAYAAMFDGRAVCQGIACMYYAMCRLAGLPVRIVTGSNHAWNIVKAGYYWYNVDATWDTNFPDDWSWFMLGSSEFDIAGHIRETPFNEAEFMSQYPVWPSRYESATSYWDVDDGNGHIQNINRVTALGLMQGTGKNRFGPAETMERCMLVTVLYRLEGEPKASANSGFSDVSSGSYYAKAVSWAAKNEIVKGVGNGRFAPEQNLTREEIVTLLYRYAVFKGYDVSDAQSLSSYQDRKTVSSYAVKPMQWAVATGIMKGETATTINPGNNAKREQLATFLIRFLSHYDAI